MMKRSWLRWVLLIVLVTPVGGGIWIQTHVDKQPRKHEDPGVPEVLQFPDPEGVE